MKTVSIICVLVIPTRAIVLAQDTTVIESLLRTVAELEKKHQECSSYQSNMLLEMTYVKAKLEQSERRISELEDIVFNVRFDEYSDTVRVPLENDTVDKTTNEALTKFTKEEEQNCSIPELKKTISNEPGIARRKRLGIAMKQIAFCATFADIAVQVHVNEIIRFNIVSENDGNVFNKQTGIFTCPLSGTYFFTVSLMTQSGYEMTVHLMVNGEIKANSFASGSTNWDQGCISSIVRCEAGQNVWIGVRSGTQLYGDYYTSFSGFFLWGDATGSR
ncbi:hypothetical protein CHS0354_018003 [Potamilus streckersoni]|uniref:C1q domain-containing protein n=1 Tax=Potamilus streckersoni TaxID=2493646 RepID=A0AAE0WA24_9BIVA|nr:hypothetical protein CHS0354_018003 [Potamilus streckersoni]